MVGTTAAELLDVVDENDQVIETRTRGDIHQRKLTHRSVHVLVFSTSGALLLQKRSMQKDECAGMWDTSCAGHVEAGQSYLDTAPRELEEELGFCPQQDLTPLFKMVPTDDNGREFAMVYETQFDGPFDVAADEIDAVEWFDRGQLDSWVVEQSAMAAASPDRNLSSGFCEIWIRYRQLG